MRNLEQTAETGCNSSFSPRVLWGVFLLTFLAIGPAFVLGQTTVEENLLEAQEDATEQSELLEQLEALRQQPLDLNAVSAAELKTIPGLPPGLQSEILNYRKQNDGFESLAELQSLPGMTPELYEFARQIFTVEPKVQAGAPKARAYWRTRVSDYVDTPVGYENGAYESGSRKIYNRGKFQFLDKYEAGLLLEKDNGEKALDDLRLFYAAARLSDNIQLVAGNYQLQFGQGLVFWGPYGFSKSSNPVYPLRKRGRGARGYLSVDENAALLGAATTVNFSRFGLTGFFSQQELDATQITENEISSPYISGFHRNENELNKKDILTEKLAGARLQFAGPRGLDIGATFYRSTFDKQFNDPNFERSFFEFRGDENHVAGLDFNFDSEKLDLFGEIARSKNQALAFLSGAQLYVDRFRLGLLYRDYQPDFQNFHGFGFGERNGATQNERGFYLGLSYRPGKNTTLDTYYDIYSFPWRTFFEPLPVDGNEFMARLEHKISRGVTVSARFRTKQREEFASELGQFHQRMQRQLRLQLDFRPLRQLRLRGRLDLVRVHYSGLQTGSTENSENGVLIYQDVVFRPGKRFSVSARLTFFDSESFDSRLFQYENDLPGRVTNRALFGLGTRWYALIKFSPLDLIVCHVKFSETYREDADVIGTGPDQIPGNLDRRFAAQIEVRL